MSHGRSYDGEDTGFRKFCRACTDFKSWMHGARPSQGDNKPPPKKIPPSSTSTSNTASDPSESDQERRHDCPLDKDQLGRSTWDFLHSVAAYTPDKPTQEQQKDLKTLMELVSKYYPCDFCAKDLRRDLKEMPPTAHSSDEFAQWMCRLHNKVNAKMEKPLFDCSKVNERWRDGWKDGSCD